MRWLEVLVEHDEDAPEEITVHAIPVTEYFKRENYADLPSYWARESETIPVWLVMEKLKNSVEGSGVHEIVREYRRDGIYWTLKNLNHETDAEFIRNFKKEAESVRDLQAHQDKPQ